MNHYNSFLQVNKGILPILSKESIVKIRNKNNGMLECFKGKFPDINSLAKDIARKIGYFGAVSVETNRKNKISVPVYCNATSEPGILISIHLLFAEFLESNTLEFVLAHEIAHAFLKNYHDNETECDAVAAGIVGKQNALKALLAVDEYLKIVDKPCTGLAERIEVFKKT